MFLYASIKPLIDHSPSSVDTYDPSLLANKSEIVNKVTNKTQEKVHIIDVRSQNEYFSKNKNLKYQWPDLNAVHIEWKQFFNQKGRPNLDIKGQLKSIQIMPEDRVIVICDNGLRSGAATFALLSLGYKKAASFAGGYQELLNQKKSR